MRTGTGTTITTVQTKCNHDANNKWVQYTFDLTSALSAYKGQQIQVHFQGKTNASLPTYYYVDDVAINVTHT
jgi:kumamolisin